MKKQKNKVRRYRLNDYTANKLGCEINSTKRYRLSKQQESELLLLAPQKVKRLFFDIETSYNVVASWRIGYNINLNPHDILRERAIISIAYKWGHEDKVHVLTWDNNQCDKKMLETFIPILNSADICVAHNGKRFDIKWLRTRCIFHGIRAFPTYKTLDTLLKAKSGFNFNSNKLDYIAKYLNVGAKLVHSGFDMWRKIVEEKDKESLKLMCEYNIQDVVVLEDVYNAMESYITPDLHVGVTNNKEKYSCPNCGSESVILLKNEVSSKGTLSRKMECQCCGSVYNISNGVYKSFYSQKYLNN